MTLQYDQLTTRLKAYLVDLLKVNLIEHTFEELNLQANRFAAPSETLSFLVCEAFSVCSSLKFCMCLLPHAAISLHFFRPGTFNPSIVPVSYFSWAICKWNRLMLMTGKNTSMDLFEPSNDYSKFLGGVCEPTWSVKFRETSLAPDLVTKLPTSVKPPVWPMSGAKTLVDKQVKLGKLRQCQTWCKRAISHHRYLCSLTSRWIDDKAYACWPSQSYWCTDWWRSGQQSIKTFGKWSWLELLGINGKSLLQLYGSKLWLLQIGSWAPGLAPQGAGLKWIKCAFWRNMVWWAADGCPAVCIRRRFWITDAHGVAYTFTGTTWQGYQLRDYILVPKTASKI